MTGTEIEKLKRYFLGEMSADDARLIDLRIMSEPDYESDVQLAEELLIEEFLDGDLPDEQRLLFETKFLTTPERVARTEIVAHLRRRSGERAPQNEPVRAGFFERIRAWFDAFGALGTVAAGAAAILVIVGFFWYLAPTTESEIARLNATSPAFDREITIGPGEFRGSSGVVIERADLGQIVLFRLAYPFKAEAVAIGIERNGVRIASLSNVRVVSNEIRVLLPQKTLDAGDYKITSEANGLPAQSYLFTVK